MIQRGKDEMATLNLAFDKRVAETYRSSSQKIRVLSEDWLSRSMYCPACGHESLEPQRNNSPVADFHCKDCGEQYELKSHKNALGRRIVDGAYKTMMERLQASNNPNLLILNYSFTSLAVANLLVIPKHFFTPETIEIRRPLAETARRAGWVGCNILLGSIPQSGRIYLIQNNVAQPKANVMELWRRTFFLREQTSQTARGWLLSVMKCIEMIGTERFSLSDVYVFENKLKEKYPANNHIKEKIRQQLQVLRTNGYLTFTNKGFYELTRRPIMSLIL